MKLGQCWICKQQGRRDIKNDRGDAFVGLSLHLEPSSV
jgi:hypothetical protein